MSVFVQAVAIMLLPFYGHLWIVFVMMVLSNIGAGAWDSATSIWLVEMWPVGNSALLQGNQFMYGLGTIVAPLLASPFVYGTRNMTENNQILTVEDRIRSLLIPFSIGGISQAIGITIH